MRALVCTGTMVYTSVLVESMAKFLTVLVRDIRPTDFARVATFVVLTVLATAFLAQQLALLMRP